jgi:enamine deaminase RidA (YjgF/YER057c/UK114 family)
MALWLCWGHATIVDCEGLLFDERSDRLHKMIRQSVYSGTPWEGRVAYCRAKRVGALIFVSGTVAVDETGGVIGAGDLYAQTSYAIRKIENALRDLGAELRHVVRTRTFVTDIGRFEQFALAHREAFEGIDPAATCVEVRRLVDPEFLVEIEADAVLEPEEKG